MPRFSSEEHRTSTARAFEAGAKTYSDVRPGYLPAALDLLGKSAQRIADIGCGTGKLTAQIAARCDSGTGLVVGVDTSADMLAQCQALLPEVALVRARAEATGLKDASFDVLTCAQTWHWVDVAAASREFARITTDEGKVVLLWNTLDVLVPWVHRLSRITHSGDTLREGFVPEIASPWTITTTVRQRWVQEIEPVSLHDLMHTRSYWLRANDRTRAKMTNNLDWYLFDHLQLDPRVPVELPYRLDAFLLEKQR